MDGLLGADPCNGRSRIVPSLRGRIVGTHTDMELSGNLYLQEEKYWERFTGRRVIPQSNHTELYFEEPEIDSFVKKLERLYPDIEYVNRLMTHSWGQRVVRLRDILIESTCHVESIALLERVSNRKADAKVHINVDLEDYYRIKDAQKN